MYVCCLTLISHFLCKSKIITPYRDGFCRTASAKAPAFTANNTFSPLPYLLPPSCQNRGAYKAENVTSP